MIAISEHLRNHGFDPDLYQHTRIPYIWQKLRTYYNLEIIDERENFDEDETEDRYIEFSLPRKQFFEAMMQRAVADPSEAPTTPAQLDLSPPPSSPPKKRKRAATTPKARGASVEDTEDGTDAPSPPMRRGRGAGPRKRAASRAKEKQEKQEKAETTEDDDGEEEDDVESSSSSDGEESAEDRGTPVSRTTRNAKRGAPAARGRTRGRRGRRGKSQN